MIETYPPDTSNISDSSQRLIRRLSGRLDDRAARLQKYDDYYRGEQRLTFATSKFRQTFGSLFSAFADNFCALVVDAVEERLDVEGFRIARDVTASPTKMPQNGPEKTAWRIWQANQLDAYSQIAHTEALIKEQSYALVWRGDASDTPEITIEDAFSAIVSYDPVSYTKRTAGLKRWMDDDGFLNVTLYLPDAIEKYRSTVAKNSSVGGWSNLANVALVPRIVPGENFPLHNPLGVVPLVPLINRPRLGGVGQSEIAGVIPIQDAINKLVTDMIVASEYSSYRQRWATGIEIPVDETTGEPIENLKAALDRMWASGNEGAKFGEFDASDLQPFVAGVEMLIQHVASSTRTPYHYFLQHGGQPPSGESLRASETGLVAKARRKQRHFGEAWEEVIRLAGLVIGDSTLAEAEATETIWRDPESRTEAEHVDALVKLGSIGVPEEQLWEDAGYTPTQTERFLEMRKREPKVPVVRPKIGTVPEMATGPAVPGAPVVPGAPAPATQP